MTAGGCFFPSFLQVLHSTTLLSCLAWADGLGREGPQGLDVQGSLRARPSRGGKRQHTPCTLRSVFAVPRGCVLGVPASLSCPSVVYNLGQAQSCFVQDEALHPKLLPWSGTLSPLTPHAAALRSAAGALLSCTAPSPSLSFSSFCAPFLPGRSLLLSVMHEQWLERVIFFIMRGEQQLC